MPGNGSFALSPTPTQLKLQKLLLTRFAKDEESHVISDSSKSSKVGRPRKTPQDKKTVFKAGRGRKVKEEALVAPVKINLPVMESGSIFLEMFPDNSHNLLADKIAQSKVCGSCFTAPKADEEAFSICSACHTVA